MRELVVLIPEWLAVTRGCDVPVGLPRDEALRRAAVLRGLLRDGKVIPDCVVLDEDLKAVFHALVALVTKIEPWAGEALAQEANSVYQFLTRVEWPDDDFCEKPDLMHRLATAGWRALGTDFAEVSARRRLLERGDAKVDSKNHFRTGPCDSDANSVARAYLEIPIVEREAPYLQSSLSNPDVVAAIVRSLYAVRDSAPNVIASEAEFLYRWLAESSHRIGLFDERDYFKGEAAFLAGCACRLRGQRDQAFRWLDRAEAGFRHTVNPIAGLASVLYARLSLRFEMGRCHEVLGLLPSLRTTFAKLGKEAGVAKCDLLSAMSLKLCGQLKTALRVLEPTLQMAAVQREPSLHARIVAEIGDVQLLSGRSEDAMASYQSALSLLQGQAVCMARADLKMFIGSALRETGDLASAIHSFRSSLEDWCEMGMATRAAYLRLFLAETLLALDRPREAEWEILQALPTIEEQKMVPEGFAAVALLRESVKRRRADPNALRELREHLQKQK